MRAVDDGRIGLDDPVAHVAARLERRRSRERHDSRSAGARVRADGVPALLSRLHRPRRVRARHLRAAARVRAAIAVDLQRPRVHAARVHPRGRAAAGPGVQRRAGQRSIRRAASRRSSIASRRSSPPSRCASIRRAPGATRTAPTEIDAWRGRLLVGEVHDENTWALGGAAGHAGLFGTAAAVGAFARAVLRTIAGEPILAAPDTMRTFITRTNVPGSSRALGWDTMLPTSSCGTRCRRRRSATPALPERRCGSIGSAISTWCFLTNRVHPTREQRGDPAGAAAAARRDRRRAARTPELPPYDHAARLRTQLKAKPQRTSLKVALGLGSCSSPRVADPDLTLLARHSAPALCSHSDRRRALAGRTGRLDDSHRDDSRAGRRVTSRSPGCRSSSPSPGTPPAEVPLIAQNRGGRARHPGREDDRLDQGPGSSSTPG